MYILCKILIRLNLRGTRLLNLKKNGTELKKKLRYQDQIEYEKLVLMSGTNPNTFHNISLTCKHFSNKKIKIKIKANKTHEMTCGSQSSSSVSHLNDVSKKRHS